MHQSVLLHEAVDGLNVRRGKVVVDATLGEGGHGRLICERLGGTGRLIAIDADGTTLLRAATFAEQGGCEVTPRRGNFRDLNNLIAGTGVSGIDGIIFDLGVRSSQLDDSGRGFSFMRPEPLIMTFDANPPAHAVTAHDVVNSWDEEHLVDILRGFGEERYAGRIARAIVARREPVPIERADELARIIEGAVPARYRSGAIHPATRTFQAIRMAVNDETGALRAGITAGFDLLNPGGRMAIISFHSIEDRIVKRLFREYRDSGRAMIITKKPIIPSAQETENNPRARSAKLRIIEKKL